MAGELNFEVFRNNIDCTRNIREHRKLDQIDDNGV